MKTHAALMEQVHAYAPKKGELAFWWMGQLGYILKTQQGVFAFDLFLRPGKGRQVAPLIDPEEATGIDYFFGSHDHIDHIDHYAWPALAKASPSAKFIVPKMFESALTKEFDLAPERVIGLDEGMVFEDANGGINISALASAHEFLDQDPETGLHPSLGYVLRCGDLVIYHSGDSCKYEGLESKLRNLGPIDLMILPINGRDAERYASGCIGNMNFAEAVDLAGALRPRLCVPGHYEMFANNSEDPEKFTKYMDAKYPGQAYWTGAHGTLVVLPGKE